MGKGWAVVRLCCPNRWLYNLLVFVGILFSGLLFSWAFLKTSLVAFVYFCIASSIGCIMNNGISLKKSLEPVFTVCILLILFLAGIFWNLTLWSFIAAFLILQLLHTLFLKKNMIIIDLFSTAFGFVLRVATGILVIDLSISSQELLWAFMGGIFLALIRRRIEGHPSTPIPMFDQWITGSGAAFLLAYSSYIFNEFSRPFMMATVPFLLYGIFRLQYLATQDHLQGKGEEVFITDKPLLLSAFLWLVVAILVLYVL